MKREQLEHLLRAASDIVAYADLLVIGSQSVLATWDERRLPRAAIRGLVVVAIVFLMVVKPTPS